MINLCYQITFFCMTCYFYVFPTNNQFLIYANNAQLSDEPRAFQILVISGKPLIAPINQVLHMEPR